MKVSKHSGMYPNEFPHLGGKAAHMKHLLPALLHVCKARAQNSSERLLRLNVLEEFQTFIDIIEAHGHYLPREASDECRRAVTQGLLSYSALAALAYTAGQRLWSFTPKFHYLYHICMFTRYHNPRYAWVFRDEDFVGRISKIAKSVSFGRPSTSLSSGIMHKHRQVLQLRYAKRRDIGG